MKLARAIMLGDIMLVRRLLAKGARPDQEWGSILGPGDEYQLSALGIAAAYGHRRIAIALIEEGACVTNWPRPKRDEEFWLTPLDASIIFENIALVKLLLENGANPNYRYCESEGPQADGQRSTALHLAARHRSAAYVRVLIRAKACVHARSRNGTTPLYEAVKYDNRTVVDTLLRAGARIESGMLTVAAGNASTAISRRLLRASAYVNERIYDICPLYAAVGSDGSLRRRENCIELLLESGACANLMTCEGDTPLHIAASRGLCGVIVMLSSYGGDRKAINHYGNTPADEACSEGFDFVVDVLSAMHDWITPLHHLTVYMNESRVRALIDARADLHARKSPTSRSPLDVARLTTLPEPFTLERQDASRVVLNYWCSLKTALAMATHPRLGAHSPMRLLGNDELEHIVEMMAL